jgi:DMSO/TMAO reductase YedYZ molybdopterin-dependent catalytic subunit
MGLAMLVARLTVAAALPPEMLFNFTAQLLGGPWVFNLVHSLPLGLDEYAKFVLFGGTMLLYIALWFAFGLIASGPLKRAGRWLAMPAFAALSAALVGLVLLPIQGLGLFGLGGGNFLYPPLESHLWAAAFGALFGAVLALALSPREGTDPARREALQQAARLGVAAAAVSLLGRVALGAWSLAQSALSAIGQIVGLSPKITPTEDHYQISKNVFNPSVPEDDWQLTVMGMVANEVTFTLDDLKALPSVERSSTLTCISNQVGGDLIGNSVWTGVRLSDLLEVAGVQPEANELILRAADNYSDSFALDAAMREGTIVAYLQNGEPLTRDHGFPARVLVPGIYGMKNLKWVLEIELTNQDYIGYWQTRGWSDSAVIRTMSRIDTRNATPLDDGRFGIGGVAYAGIRGIATVEVSIDGGGSWEQADLEPADNGLSWNRWAYAWEATPGSSYEVLVRATDGEGTLQSEERERPLPNGSSGYHRETVRVG